MKWLKKIGLALVAFILLLLLVGLFLPSTVTVKRSVSFSLDKKARAFELLNVLKNWELWSPWQKKDPKMLIDYSGPASGKGAKYAWRSDHKQVGNGSLEILESVEGQFLRIGLDFSENGTSEALFAFEDKGEECTLTWSMNADFGYNIPGRYFGLFMDKFLGPDFESGLAGIKEAIAKEAAPKMMPTSIDWVQEWKQGACVSVERSCTPAALSDSIKSAYTLLDAYVTRLHAKVRNSFFVIYKSQSADKVTFTAVLPYDNGVKPSRQVQAKRYNWGAGILADYYGPSGKLPAVRSQMKAMAEQEKRLLAKEYVEVYVKSALNEADSNQWQTQIFIQEIIK